MAKCALPAPEYERLWRNEVKLIRRASAVPVLCSDAGLAPGPIARELLGHAARAGSPRERPTKTGFLNFLIPGSHAQARQVQAHEREILFLVEGWKTQPQPEAFGQGDFFLAAFARMQFVVLPPVFVVFVLFFCFLLLVF